MNWVLGDKVTNGKGNCWEVVEIHRQHYQGPVIAYSIVPYGKQSPLMRIAIDLVLNDKWYRV